MTITRHDPALLNRTGRKPWAGPGLFPRRPVGLLLAAALAAI